jgi:hypothetical protein
MLTLAVRALEIGIAVAEALSAVARELFPRKVALGKNWITEIRGALGDQRQDDTGRQHSNFLGVQGLESTLSPAALCTGVRRSLHLQRRRFQRFSDCPECPWRVKVTLNIS